MRVALAYSTWLDFDVKPVIPIADAVGKIGSYLSDWEITAAGPAGSGPRDTINRGGVRDSDG